MARRSKYGNKKVEADGLTFDSQSEYMHYCTLRLLERAGEITDLQVHPRYLLQDKFRYRGKSERAIYYEGDFEYVDVASGKRVVVDVKGARTEVFKLKRKLFLAKYGNEYEFEEIAA